MADGNMAKNESDVFKLLVNDIEKQIPVSTNSDDFDSLNLKLNERLIRTLEKHIFFLEEEVKRKDAMINNLIEMASHNKYNSNSKTLPPLSITTKVNDILNGQNDADFSNIGSIIQNEDIPLLHSKDNTKTNNDPLNNDNNNKHKKRNKKEKDKTQSREDQKSDNDQRGSNNNPNGHGNNNSNSNVKGDV